MKTIKIYIITQVVQKIWLSAKQRLKHKATHFNCVCSDQLKFIILTSSFVQI